MNARFAMAAERLLDEALGLSWRTAEFAKTLPDDPETRPAIQAALYHFIETNDALIQLSSLLRSRAELPPRNGKPLKLATA